MPSLAHKLNIWQRFNRRVIPAALALCALYTGVMNWFRDYQFGIGRVLAGGLVVFVLLVYAPRARQLAPTKRLWPLGLFGCLNAFFMVAMRTALTPAGGGQWKAWLWLPFLLFAATYTLCAAGAFVLLSRVRLSAGAPEKPLPKYALPLAAGLLLVLWSPYLATFGPVRMSADSYDVVSQALGVAGLNDSHPIAYTLLVAAFLRPAASAGNIMLGAYLLGLAQLAMVAFTLAHATLWLRRRGCPALVCLLAFLFYGLSGVFPINALTLWKDIPFNCLLLLLMLQLWQLAETKGGWLLEKNNVVKFILVCLGTCFARGNGFALVLAACAAVALMYRAHWRRWLALFAPLLLFVLLVRGPVYAALGITRLGGVEAAAMPIQQVSRLVAQGVELTPEQEEIIRRFVPPEVMAENYEPTSPDNIKKHPAFNSAAFSQNAPAFLGLWLQLWPANAGEYANAWLTQTMGYWKYDYSGETVYLVDELNGLFGIEYKDLLFKLTGLNFNQFFANRTGFATLGLMALITLFAGALLIAKGQKALALGLLPPVLVWLGLMLGAPTYSDFRYMLVFALALPVICFVPLAHLPAGGGPKTVETVPDECYNTL